MFRAGRLIALALVFGFGMAWADSIRVDGVVYENVEVKESSNRYYVHVPADNRTFSVLKENIKEGDLQFGPVKDNAGSSPLAVSPDKPAENAGAASSSQTSTTAVPLEAGASMVTFHEGDGGPAFEANVLVLRLGDALAAFCSIDLCVLDQTLTKAVGDLLTKEQRLTRQDTLILSPTHTYAGPYPGIMKGVLQELAFGTFSQENVDKVAEIIVRAITEAESAFQPVQLKFVEGAAPQLVANLSEPAGAVDPALVAMRVETPEGKPVAYMVNFAAQPNLIQDALIGPARHRDFPGSLTATLREGASIPVLFMNGAMGAAAPKPPSGSSLEEMAQAVGAALGRAVLDMMPQAQVHNPSKIETHARRVDLPESLLADLAPRSTVLQDFWIGDAVFLTLPGEATGSIGIALRRKAAERGAKYTFLCGPAGDYTGYHTDVDEYYQARIASKVSFYGPMMISWYLANHLPGIEGAAPPPPWRCSQLVQNNRDAYLAGVSRGKTDRDTIFVAWNNVNVKLGAMADMVARVSVLTGEAKALLDKVSHRDAVKAGVQYAAIFAREHMNELTDAQRAALLGVADGAHLPLDAVLLLQYIVNPAGVPPEAAQLISDLQFTGIDFLGELAVDAAAGEAANTKEASAPAT